MARQAHIAEEASQQEQSDWEYTPSYIERFREERSSFEAEAHRPTRTFCGICGFWVDGPCQCLPTQVPAPPHADSAPRSPRRLTAFCPTRPGPNEVERALQELGFHLTLFMPAETGDPSASLPPLPAQFHYEDEVGTRVEYLAGTDVPCLADEDDENAAISVPPSYPPHRSRFWLTAGGQALAMRRTREMLAKRWSLYWQEQREAVSLDEVA